MKWGLKLRCKGAFIEVLYRGYGQGQNIKSTEDDIQILVEKFAELSKQFRKPPNPVSL